MKILFCIDDSIQWEAALRFGAQITVACRAEPSVLAITSRARRESALTQAVVRAQDIFRERQISVKAFTRVGDPVREIINHTTENQYDLVVLGALCKGKMLSLIAPWWLSAQAGSAHRIIESVEPPVLVVFCSAPELRRILLCTSGDSHTNKAVEFAGKLARCIHAAVNLFHVMQEPPAVYADLMAFEENADRLLASNSKLGRALRYQKNLLERLGVFGEIRLRHGLVVPELLKELQTGDYDLVVSGSAPAEQKLYRYVMGDVTREIVNRAQLPVLVVRTGPGKIAGLFRELLTNMLLYLKRR